MLNPTVFVLPVVARGLSICCPNERQQTAETFHLEDIAQHCAARNMVVSSHTVDGQHRGRGSRSVARRIACPTQSVPARVDKRRRSPLLRQTVWPRTSPLVCGRKCPSRFRTPPSFFDNAVMVAIVNKSHCFWRCFAGSQILCG